MKLHENKSLFQQAITATAQQMKFPEIHIEKDYWVTVALKKVFSNETAAYTVFKGGTALSKCNKLIERFSEDIDLVIIHDGTESDNQLKKRIKSISDKVAELLPEVEERGITHKRGMIRKTAHQYDKLFKYQTGQTRDKIIVEATWLGYFEPYKKGEVSSFVYEMMKAQDQLALAEEYELLPFEVNVLDPKRTICEKIMSLVRFSYTANPIEDLAYKIRHTYDLYQLLQDEGLKQFFESSEFEKMLNKVAQDDVKSFKNNNGWLQNHPSQALIFEEHTWGQLASKYQGEFKEMIYGAFPSPEFIESNLKNIYNRLLTINWNVQL